MKRNKNYFYACTSRTLVAIALVAMMISCEEQDIDAIEDNTEHKMILRAEKDQATSSTDTRTSIADQGLFTWAANDKLNLYTRSANAKEEFTIVSEGASSAEFTGTLTANSEIVYAAYTSDADAIFNNTNYTSKFVMSQTQKYISDIAFSAESIGTYALMFGRSAAKVTTTMSATTDVDISMNQLTAILDFKITEIPEGTVVNTLHLRANSAIFPNKVMVPLDGSTTTYEVKTDYMTVALLNAEGNPGVTVGSSKTLTIRLAMLPTTVPAEGTLTISLSIGNDASTKMKSVVKTFSNAKTYEAGKIYDASLNYGSDFAAGENQTLSSISTLNRFANEDVVSFSDGNESKVSSISQIITPSTETALLSDIRDFDFNLTTATSLSFNISVENLKGTEWKLCKSKNGVWSEIEGATYESNRAKASFTLSPTSKVSSSNVFAIRIALLKTSSLINTMTSVHNETGGVNPFGAMVTFKSAVEITPTMTLIGQDDNNIVHTFKSGTEHRVNVLGLYNDHTNTVFIDSRTAAGTTLRTKLNFTVDYPYFTNNSNLKIKTTFAEGFRNAPDALYFICGNGQNIEPGADHGKDVGIAEETRLVAFDQHGKIRWTYNKGATKDLMAFPTKYKGKNSFFHFKQAKESSLVISDYNGNELYKSDIASKNINRPHHDVVKISDNIVAIPETQRGHDECEIVEFNLETQQVVKRIDLSKIIDPNRENILTGWTATDDHIHINSIAYSASDNCYVISARHQGVIKISRDENDTPKLKWWMTPHHNVGDAYKFSLLNPTNFSKESVESWNLGQHSVSILPNGDIMMFDNHNQPKVGAENTGRSSRILVMSVNEANKTVTKVSEWTPDNDFSFYMSNAIMLPNGNVLSGWAVQKKVYETSTSGVIQFEASFEPSYLRGDTYRAYKINLYK